MSRVNELLADLCPDGVEFVPLSELTRPVSRVDWSSVDPDEPRQYIDLATVDRSTHSILGTQTITATTAPARAQQLVRRGDVLFGTTRPTLQRYCVVPPSYDGQVCSSAFCVLRPSSDRLLVNFLFHSLGSPAFRAYVEAQQRGSNYPAISDRAIKRFRIALPPLEVQAEIARTLDMFAELKAELEAELEARRHQFAYYRDTLLSFANGGAKWIPMGEVGEFLRGKRFTKADYVDEGIPCIHYGEIYTHYGTAATEAVRRIRPELGPRMRFAEPGDVIIAEVGETVADVGKALAWVGIEKVAVHDGCFIFRHDLNPAYVSYCLQTAAYHAQKAQYVSRAKVKRLLLDGIKKITIPVPPRSEQDRLVQVLDNFDALVNDLTSGLPAELRARKQQYEYYRDRLLTFEEAA